MELIVIGIFNCVLAIIGLCYAQAGRTLRWVTGEPNWSERVGVTLMLISGVIAVYMARLV